MITFQSGRKLLLKLTILALLCTIVSKSAWMINAAWAQSAAAQAAPVAPAQRSMPVTNWDSTPPPPAVCKPDPLLGTGETKILLDLRARAHQLDERSAALDRKQLLVDAASRALAAQIDGLKAVQARLTALSVQASAHDEARWQSLVSMYQAMQPADAARIFDKLDMDVLLGVLRRMNDRKAAPILAAMSPDRAREATERMAGVAPSLNLTSTSQ